MGAPFNNIEHALEKAKLNQVTSSSYSGYSSNRLEYPPVVKLTPNANESGKTCLTEALTKNTAPAQLYRVK